MSGEPPIAFVQDHGCFGCGTTNAHGLHLRIRPDPDTDGVITEFVPDIRFQGYDGMVHGGIVATVLDEVMAWSLYGAGIWAVTAGMSIRFRRPLIVGSTVIARGRIARDRGRLFDLAGTIHDDTGVLLAEATGTFMRVPESQAIAWRQRYLESDLTLEQP